ncbi:MAG: hypothetical protein WA639_21585 [Candidatus Acidiferrum sp.]
MAKKPATPEDLARLKEALDAAEFDFDNAKLAYFHRAAYKGQEVTYEVLKSFAETYIARNYDYQKAAFGRVRIRLSVARLLRE